MKRQLDDEECKFYSTALRCRNFGMGIAAVSYMRRVVERKVYSLLDLIIELDKSQGRDIPLAADIEDIKRKRPSDVLDFAGKLLPTSLKPAGKNPLEGLYGVFSDGLHNRPESECTDIFDKAKRSFEYLFERLRSELDAAATYLKASEEVEQLKSKAKDSKAVRSGPS